MAARKKTKRRPPAKHARPSVAIPVARPHSAASEAIAALDQSAPALEVETSSGGAAGTPEQPTSPLASRDADNETRDSASPSAVPAAPSPASPPSSTSSSAPKKPAAAKVSLTGNKFSGLNRDQLRTVAAMAENRIAELEAQVKTQAKAAAAVSLFDPEDLEEPVGETWAMLYELLALKFGDEFLLDEKQQSRMGRVWAGPVAKLVEHLTQSDPERAAVIAPLAIAIAITGGVTIAKVRRVKRRRDEDARRAAGAEPSASIPR